jgi:hydroxypyruvate isomerase
MPKFCANLSMLFPELPFLDRFAAAAQAGFEAVECQFPYIATKDAIAERLAQNALTHVLINLPAGDFEKGDRGMACDPSRTGEFQDGVGLAIGYAKAMNCGMINCLAGIRPESVPHEKAIATLIDSLRFAAKALAAEGILLLIEPINPFDIPGFLVNRSSEALHVMDEVASENLKLQYDIYHMQRQEGALAETMERLLPRIGHIQVADTPGRHEPGTGEINFPFLFEHLDRIGYAGWVGAEYKPQGGTLEGLTWLP